MKNALFVYIAFAVGSLLQLISSTIFLFADTESITKAVIQIVLLLLTAAALIGGEILLKHSDDAVRLEHKSQKLMTQIGRISGIVLTIETVCVVFMVSSTVISIPLWVHVMPVLALGITCIVAAWICVHAFRVRDNKTVDRMPVEDESVEE